MADPGDSLVFAPVGSVTAANEHRFVRASAHTALALLVTIQPHAGFIE